MKLPPNYGPEYTQAFETAYGDLAKRYKTALVPFLLEGFGEKPDFFQQDRIHPTVQAQPLMADRVAKALAPLLK
jgi:acyl-CoA thioesterase-1